MSTPGQREVLHLFDNSICPDPNVFVFLGFTIFTLLWMLHQSILSSQPPSVSRTRGTLATIILSITYTSVLAIQLLDGCWIAVIYGWGLSKTVKGGARGLVDWMFTWLILCVLCTFLLAIFLLWVVTVIRTVKRLILLWSSGPASLPDIAAINEKVAAPMDSK